MLTSGLTTACMMGGAQRARVARDPCVSQLVVPSVCRMSQRCSAGQAQGACWQRGVAKVLPPRLGAVRGTGTPATEECNDGSEGEGDDESRDDGKGN